MTVTVYIWPAFGGSTLNIALYEFFFKYLRNFTEREFTRSGHVSIQIGDDLYISHRPNINDLLGNISNVATDTSIKSYQDEIKIRKTEATHKISIDWLDEQAMRQFYDEENKKAKKGIFTYYHFSKNNCSTVVVKLLKKGMSCTSEKCDLCKPSSYSEGFLSLGTLIIKPIVGSIVLVYVAMIFSSILGYSGFFELIFSSFSSFLTFIIVLLFTILVFFPANIWTPSHLKKFAKKIVKKPRKNPCRSWFFF